MLFFQLAVIVFVSQSITDSYLDEDIIGLNVYVDDRLLGKVNRIDKHSVNEILVIKNDEKNYLVPYNFDIILNVDLEKREMKVRNIVGLFD